MLFVTIFRFPPEKRQAVVERFMKTGGMPPPGVKLLGRWHDLGGGRGFTVSESDDPVAAGKYFYDWTDLMTFETVPVSNDEQLAKILAG